MARQYKNLKGIAAYLQFSTRKVRREMKRPIDPLPAKKIGGTYYFDVARVDAWWDRQDGPGGQDIDV